MSPAGRALAGCLLLIATGRSASAQHINVPETMGAEQGRQGLEQALAWLVENQKPDGSWAHGVLEGVLELGFSVESFYSWQVASNAIACMALLHAPETPERRATLERGLRWLAGTRVPQRGDDWDIDYVWGGLYGFIAAAEAAADPRFQGGEWSELLARIGRHYFAILEMNQIPNGGWGYYDDPIYSRRPKWATSFSTATVLPALRWGEEHGWVSDPLIRMRATEYVKRCALPNGAFSYDERVIPWIGGESINQVKGSLSRIQVCHWALASVGEKKITPDRIRTGLESFFRDHRFLDVAFLDPIPHEAYYYNSGYFYLFGHYYASQVINLLPAAEREGWHARLRPHLVKVQREDGSTSDFMISGYAKVAGTGFLALALELGLGPAAIPKSIEKTGR